MMTRLIILPLLLGTVLAAGCGGSGRLRYENAEEAYAKGLSLYERGKYERAVDYLQGVFDYGRTHQWAADAQLLLARAYRDNEEYLLAANEYTRFIEIYRTDPRVPEAEYERAMTYYTRSPRFQLDQTDTERAIEQFLLFISRHPDSANVPDAEAKIAELREKLARKQFTTAELYERREMYEAAALSYQRLFDNYPDTKYADDALLGAMRMFIAFSEESIRERQAERLQEAVDIYQRMIQILPDSPLLKDAELLYEQAANRLEALTETAQG